jgi:hypothetical protein
MAKLNQSLDKILKETDGLYYSYVPAVAIALESVNAALMLCYLVHWDGRGWKKDNWIYKSMEEMLAGTGLTRDQQDSAIRVLTKHGFVKVERRGDHGVRHFRVDMEKVSVHLAPLWKSSKRYKPPKPKSNKRDSGKVAMTFAENQQSYTEETHNDTYRTNLNAKINPSLPGGQVEPQKLRPDDSIDKPSILEGEIVGNDFSGMFGNNSRGSPDDKIIEI